MTKPPSRTRTRTTETTKTPSKDTTTQSDASTGGDAPTFTALNALSAQVGKRMGDHVMRVANVVPGFNHTELGIFTLDLALMGGIPDGLVTQIYGWESCGKTTAAMRAAAACQRKNPDKAVVYIDAEHTFDPVWAEYHGVDMSRLYLVQPESGENAIDILDASLRTKETCLAIVDSLPALVPQKEIDSSTEDANVALVARLVGRACSKILSATQSARRTGHNPTTILINQFRTKIGVMFGDPRTLPGGNQPKFLSSVMIEFKKKKEVMGKDSSDMELIIQNEHAFTIKKSKVGNSLREGEYVMNLSPESPLLHMGQVDDASTVVTYARKLGFITGGGSSWKIDMIDGGSFKSLQAVADYLYENLFDFMVLKARIVAHRRVTMGLSAVPPDGYLMGCTYDELSMYLA